ncbi:MAG TPA: inositol monophosphatase family protein [Actinomycetota bacterium]|nr:inositol monophosphatase family protein [Actinomycetota bacterium]
MSMSRYGQADLQVTTKPDMTPVSDADRSVEQLIREHLGRVRPDDAVLGEEYGGTMGAGRAWVIDPIDGTKNFVRRVPVWATLIALTVDGQAQVGVVSAPALGRRWWAATGEGSWRSEQGREAIRNRVSGVRELADASLSFSDDDGWDRTSFLGLIDAVWRSRGYGDFWSHVMVAEGCVDIAAEPALNLWDMAALVPVVREAGGSMTTWSGEPVLSGTSALTTNGLLHDTVLARLRHG